MSIETKKRVGTIDLTPSWVTAVKIYCDVLEGSKSLEARKAAREDLMALGRSMDEINAKKSL